MTAAESDAEQQEASRYFQDLVQPTDVPQSSYMSSAEAAKVTQEAAVAGEPGTATDPPPQWEIQTDREKYVDTLEKRLKRVKTKRPVDGQSNGSKSNGRTAQRLQLPMSDSDSDGSDGEDAMEGLPATTEVQDEMTETTCLLYDAHQQDKERKRRLENESVGYGVNTYLQDAAHIEEGSHDSDQIRTSSSGPSGPNPRRSSLHSRSAAPQALILFPEACTTPAQSPSRIQFRDSVRISGGVKSSRHSRILSLPNALATCDNVGANTTGPSTSTNTIYTQSSPATSHFTTPRGSFSHSRSASGRISRAASFLSEDGTGTGRSRASTPASIYAPLLIPSKSAPSPSRHFYLTFKRADGQATYRELVRRQSERRKKRRRGRTRSKLRADDDSADDEDEDMDDYSRQCGNGWICGITFWTCGMSQVFGSWRRRKRWAQGLAIADSESQMDTAATEETQSNISIASSSEPERHTSRQQNKSEMQVLFGNKPWRFLRLGYWSYRTRGIRGVQQLLGEEEEEV